MTYFVIFSFLSHILIALKYHIIITTQHHYSYILFFSFFFFIPSSK